MVFRAKSQNNEKSNTELELFELLTQVNYNGNYALGGLTWWSVNTIYLKDRFDYKCDLELAAIPI